LRRSGKREKVRSEKRRNEGTKRREKKKEE